MLALAVSLGFYSLEAHAMWATADCRTPPPCGGSHHHRVCCPPVRYCPYGNYGNNMVSPVVYGTPVTIVPSPTTVYQPTVYVTNTNVSYTRDAYGNIIRITKTITFSDGHVETQVTDAYGNPL